MDRERFETDLSFIFYYTFRYEKKFLHDLVDKTAIKLNDIGIGIGESAVYYENVVGEKLEKQINTEDLLDWVEQMEQYGKETDSSSD